MCVDLLKLASAFGVVWAHIEPSTDLARNVADTLHVFRVPMFFVVALYFMYVRLDKITTVGLTRLGLDRLLVPYIFWSAIYYILRTVKYQAVGRVMDWDYPQMILFGGAAIHLYFLPMLLFMKLVIVAAGLCFQAGRMRWMGLLVAVAALVFGWFGHLSGGHFEGIFLQSGVYILAASGLFALQGTSRGRWLNVGLGLGGLLFATGKFIYGPRPTDLGRVESVLMVYAIVALVLNVRWGASWMRTHLGWLLNCSYGIYLSHHAIFEGIEFVAVFLGFDLAPYSGGKKTVVGIGVCVIAIALVSLTRRHSALLSYCLLGERVRGATASVREKTVLRVSQTSLHATEAGAASFTEKSYANQ